MAKYVCMWRDNSGVEHATEKAAREADAKIEIEYKKEVRRQNLIFQFRKYLSGHSLPYFRNDLYYGGESAYRQSEQNRDKMIEWIIKNEDMIKAVLNG